MELSRNYCRECHYPDNDHLFDYIIILDLNNMSNLKSIKLNTLISKIEILETNKVICFNSNTFIILDFINNKEKCYYLKNDYNSYELFNNNKILINFKFNFCIYDTDKLQIDEF